MPKYCINRIQYFSWNRPLMIICFSCLAASAMMKHLSLLLRALSKCCYNSDRIGVLTTSLGSLFWYLPYLLVRKLGNVKSESPPILIRNLRFSQIISKSHLFNKTKISIKRMFETDYEETNVTIHLMISLLNNEFATEVTESWNDLF